MFQGQIQPAGKPRTASLGNQPLITLRGRLEHLSQPARSWPKAPGIQHIFGRRRNKKEVTKGLGPGNKPLGSPWAGLRVPDGQ
jgi:hypothetical protein